MTDEMRKEICKAFYVHKTTVSAIAEGLKLDSDEVAKAVRWGEQTRYTDELKERGE